MAGISKRPASYVPPEYRARLDKLSKADLMELAWSLASILEEDDPERAMAHLVSEREILDTTLELKVRKF